MRAVIAAIICCVGCAAAPTVGTIRGYVMDAQGRPASHARVTAAYIPPTDQDPPQSPQIFGKATTDSTGEFALPIKSSRHDTLLIASFDGQSGVAAVSFDHPVRIQLRYNRPRVSP
jgi:hypothetical protein